MAYNAALDVFKKINPENPLDVAKDIDLIVLTTASPDHQGFPSTACIVQDKIGAKNAAAFDIMAGCTGFIYALEIASNMLKGSAMKKALVIGADTLSKITDWTDRNTCVLFGDGAGAAILEKTEDKNRSGIIRSILKADGSGSNALMMSKGGSRNPYKAGEVVDKPAHIVMDGHAVYLFAVGAITNILKQICEEEKISFDDVKYIIPHQANERIVSAAAKRLGISLDKFFLNLERYANTSTASIPLALNELANSGKLNKGDIILTVGFGAGLTYGANVIIC